MLTIKHLTPINQGRTRLIYPHPTSSDLLVKVMRPEVLSKLARRPWLRLIRPGKASRLMEMELKHQIFLHSRGESAPFIQKVFSLEKTDLGKGLVVEALRTQAGAYAPTLGHLIKTGAFASAERELLAAHAEDILRSRCVVYDFNMDNLVLAYRDGTGPSFVMVDGFGERELIKKRTLIRALNDPFKKCKLEKFLRKVDRVTSEPATEVRGRA